MDAAAGPYLCLSGCRVTWAACQELMDTIVHKHPEQPELKKLLGLP